MMGSSRSHCVKSSRLVHGKSWLSVLAQQTRSIGTVCSSWDRDAASKTSGPFRKHSASTVRSTTAADEDCLPQVSNLKCPSEPRLLDSEVGDAQGGAVLPFFVCSLREGVVIPPGQGL